MKINFHLSGRLGNQLFQWAFLHDLVARGHEIRIFVDKYHNNVDEIDLKFLLNYCEHLPQVEVRNNLGKVMRLREKLISLGMPTKLTSRIFPIHIESVPARRFLNLFPQIVDGFFIDKKWVEKNKNPLLSEVNHALSDMPKSSELLSLISHDSWTRVHIRRGDYNQFKNTFGLLSRDYYKSVLKLGEELIVLTDSINQARELLKDFPQVIFVDPAEYDAWDALLIIRHGKKFIMSNSTLSWWAGLLAFEFNGSKISMPHPFYYEPSNFDSKLAMAKFDLIESKFE